MSDPVFKKDKVYQRFNLKEIFGVDLSDYPEIRQSVASAIIEKIVTRTKDGYAIGGNRELKEYSLEYKNSLNFKAAGKKPSDVNMTLNGDMLDTLTLIDETNNTITIGWDDDLQSAKAFNHNTGDTKGMPRRPFFGLNKTEITDLKSQFKSEIRAAVKTLKEEGRDAATEKLSTLIDDLAGDDGED